MKRIISLVLIIESLFFLQYAQAQVPVLWGLTAGGGANNQGVAFSINGDGTGYTNRYSFTVANGDQPLGGFMKGSNGKLYATDYWDGTNGVGALFSFTTVGNTYTNVYNMVNSTGGHPGANLTEYAGNGKFYGITQAGGANGYGTIFNFNPSSGVYTDLYDFNMTNGGLSEHCTLVLHGNGKFYGLASSGGTNSKGVIFSFDPVTNSYFSVWNFNGSFGSYPLGGLLVAGNGRLYGLAGSGGANNLGVLFSYIPSSNTYSGLYIFDGFNGSHPHGSLMQASNGLLYGMTYDGGSLGYGVIFSFDPALFIYTKLYEFDGFHGTKPEGALIQGSDGKLYGMTHYGGAYNKGVVFSFDINSNIYADLLDFDGTNGSTPFGDLLEVSTVASSKPFPSFQSSSSVLCADSCVSFTDMSTNSPSSWLWTFQGGMPASSTAKNPNVCYLSSGKYNVKLVVTNGSGTDSVSMINYITVLVSPPAPSITKSNDTLYCSSDTSYYSYQWYANNVILGGQVDSFLVISAGGNYNVQVTNRIGCSIASGINVNVGLPYLPSHSSGGAGIYPNPVWNRFTVYGLPFKVVKCEILNILGQVCQQSEIVNPKSEIAIDVSSLPRGIYFVEATGDRYKWIGKFIKQ